MAETLIDLSGLPRICTPALDAFQSALEGSSETPFDALSRRKAPIYELAGFTESDTFSFTASGAESINEVHWTAFIERARKEGKCHFVTTPNEDASLLQSLKRLEDLGCFVHIAPVDSYGRVDVAKLRALLGPKIAMLSMSAANRLTGVVQPLSEIGALAQEMGVWLHLEASHTLAKMPHVNADYLTFDGSALHAGPGSGGAFARSGKPLLSFLLGAEINVPAFMALSAACAHATLYVDTMGLEIARLRALLEEGIRERVPGAVPLFTDCLRLPDASTLLFPHIHQESLLYALRRKGLGVSIGGGSAPHLHRQLQTCGFDELAALSALSFSLNRFTSQADVERAIALIAETCKQLRPLAEDLFP